MDTFANKSLLILGLARQGKALARFAVAAGASVTVSDIRPETQLQPTLSDLADLNIHFVLGKHPLSLLNGLDILAISGGVPANLPIVLAARERGIPITNDSLEFLRRSPAPVIGITGSAGKTTTTSLVGAMGKASRLPTWVGGNIGFPLIEKLSEMSRDDIVVQELSSFQLEIWDASPTIAGVLNITPNHLDRHKTMEAYTEAKANIVRFQKDSDVAVLGADDERVMDLVGLCPGRVRTFSLNKSVQDGAFLQNDQLVLRDGNTEQAVCHLSDIPLRGQHNVANALAAIALADSAGIPVPAMRHAIKTFSGVEHRLEIVATINGVHYINDSIATAPERALAALDSFDEPLILLAGGKDKAMDWDTWASRVPHKAKAVVLFGELAPMLAERLNGLSHQTTTMAEAITTATHLAQAGDVVLLSPGGTSFDAFDNFAERGRVFKELVQGLTD